MSRKRTASKLKYRPVPNPTSVCSICLRNAGLGYHYYSVETARAHPGCKCAAILGIKGQFEVEYYTDKYFHDRWKSVTVIDEVLARGSVDSLMLETGTQRDDAVKAIMEYTSDDAKRSSEFWVKRIIEALSCYDADISLDWIVTEHDAVILNHELNNVFHSRLIGREYDLFPCGDAVFCVRVFEFDEYEFLWKAPIHGSYWGSSDVRRKMRRFGR